jgi:hypothetical protein
VRRFVPKPKDRRKVPIPSELRDSMRDVFELVEHAKHDRDIAIGYDDAIQVGAVCGGRCGTKGRPFTFTYYPEGDQKRGRWNLTLHKLEIEDIGDGRMTEITMYCCTAPDCRTKSREDNVPCFFCDYEDDAETVAYKARLEALAQKVSTKEEWIAG